MRTLTLTITALGAMIIGLYFGPENELLTHRQMSLPSSSASQPSDYPIKAVPPTDVRLTDSFWRPRLETNRSVTIPHIMRQNEVTGRVDNFLKAARKISG